MKDIITINVSMQTACVVFRHGKYDGAAFVTVDGALYNAHIEGVDHRILADDIADAAYVARDILVRRAVDANTKLRVMS